MADSPHIPGTTTLVPIIDFSPFLQGTPSENLDTSYTLLSAMKEVGFCMLTGYETVVSQEVVSEAFDQVHRFFEQPIEKKEALAWESAASNRGYVRHGRERVTQATSFEEIEALRAAAPDLKETLEIGNETSTTYHNRWPSETDLPTFKSFMQTFFLKLHGLQMEILRAIAMALELDDGFFDLKVDEMAHNLRLLNYPSIDTSDGGSGSRAGSHSDYGCLTLLFQDNVGGLEVQDTEGRFIPLHPVPHTVIVNIGDLLQRCSNDVLKSTIHRVVLPQATTPGGLTPQRNSIAFFSNFNLDLTIETLPGCGDAKYEPVKCGEYLERRLAETFG